MSQNEDMFRETFKSRLSSDPEQMKRFKSWILDRPLHGGDMCEGLKDRAIDEIISTYAQLESEGKLTPSMESSLGSALWRMAEMKCAPQGRTTKIVKNEWDEFEVRLYEDGKMVEGATYHTSDKDDAEETAKEMVKC